MQRTRQPKRSCGVALMLPVTAVLALVVFGVYVQSASSSEEGIPLQITHQGVIKVSGLRFTGNGYFKFALVDGANINFWTHDNTHVGHSVEPDSLVTVDVQEGVYSVALGGAGMYPIDTSVFTEHDELYLRIWFTDGVSSAFALPLDPPLKVTSTGYAYQAFSVKQGSVPIGTVLDWWRPNDTYPVPEGFQICDGSRIDDPDSPWFVEEEEDRVHVPNLFEKFVRGVTDPANIGQAGGSATAIHTHSIDHNHPSATAAAESEGGHQHQWSTSSTDVPQNIYDGAGTRWSSVQWVEKGSGGDWTGVVWGSAGPLYTHNDGAHVHDVDLPDYTGDSGPASPDNIPPYVGLLKIMRIK
ncbi:MAG: hypothetical protein KAV82_05735 [Phycisphaerae bacterium]|nr:hypothetical protein [Phycisphaerae bacterium]